MTLKLLFSASSLWYQVRQGIFTNQTAQDRQHPATVNIQTSAEGRMPTEVQTQHFVILLGH